MEMVNGYVFLDLTKTNVYAKALKVLGADKPVVIKDGGGSPYFVDSLTLDGTNVVITKGGKTITIANDNTITSTGDVLTIMENIVDSEGNMRFVEGELTTAEISGVTFSYAKFSLSGTHLMVVLGGSVANAVDISHNSTLATFDLPDYIFDKIKPLFGTVVYAYTETFFSQDGSTNQVVQIRLQKDTNNMRIYNIGNFTATADREFRIQFDLLIDADYSE